VDRFSGAFAADAVVAIGPDGTEYVSSLFGDTPVPDGTGTPDETTAPTTEPEPEGESGEEAGEERAGVAVASSSAAAEGLFDNNVIVSGPSELGTGSDKSWIAVDTSSASPHQGTIYVAWTAFGANSAATVALSSSTDGGATYSEPRAIADDGFGVQLAVRPNGQLDIVSFNSNDESINHVFSTDGGATFSAPEMITTPTEGIRRDLPTVAVDPSGRLLACWLHSTETRGPGSRCATNADGVWSDEVELAPDASDETLVVFPAVAASADGFWVLAYRVDDVTDVVLYRSIDGGQTFTPYETIDTRNIPRANFCAGVAHDTACRYDLAATQFLPGDYVGLSAADGRVAAAYVLTDDEQADGFATTRVRVLDIND
jgi:BNR repeat-like domain